jgi:drug/metabolite transporter (DMT)-like permease
MSSLPVHEIAALSTALCWAVTGLIGYIPSNHLGAFAYSWLRQASVAVLLAALVWFSGRWQFLDGRGLTLLFISGSIGVFLGDTLLFITMNRLGPRRAGLLFALNAPITVVLGWLVLGEHLTAAALIGIALTTFGVMLAIIFRKSAGSEHKAEQVRGTILGSIGFGLLAALCQSIGSIIMRPLMQSGIDPFLAAMFRVGTGAVCLTVLMMLPLQMVKAKAPFNMRVTLLTLLAGFVAMGVGMTLLMFALAGGNTAIVSALSATSPALLLPILWFYTGQRPTTGAWVGAFCVVLGIGTIFLTR